MSDLRSCGHATAAGFSCPVSGKSRAWEAGDDNMQLTHPQRRPRASPQAGHPAAATASIGNSRSRPFRQLPPHQYCTTATLSVRLRSADVCIIGRPHRSWTPACCFNIIPPHSRNNTTDDIAISRHHNQQYGVVGTSAPLRAGRGSLSACVCHVCRRPA